MKKKMLCEVLSELNDARFEIEIEGRLYSSEFQSLETLTKEAVSEYSAADVEVFQVEEERYSFYLEQIVEVEGNKIFAESLDSDEQVVIHVYVPANLE